MSSNQHVDSLRGHQTICRRHTQPVVGLTEDWRVETCRRPSRPVVGLPEDWPPVVGLLEDQPPIARLREDRPPVVGLPELKTCRLKPTPPPQFLFPSSRQSRQFSLEIIQDTVACCPKKVIEVSLKWARF